MQFLGVGVSGGDLLLEAVAAKVNGNPCAVYHGPGSAGHFVKMVHNGIEYAVMQLLAETYDLMKRGLGLSDDAPRDVESRGTQRLPDRDHQSHLQQAQTKTPRRRRGNSNDERTWRSRTPGMLRRVERELALIEYGHIRATGRARLLQYRRRPLPCSPMRWTG